MMENGNIDRELGWENKFILMALITTDILQMIILKESEELFMLMENSMRENGKEANVMEKGYIFLKIILSIKGTGLMI